ncbi:MAG: carbon monoxide dehydrogenase subunit G [Chloroflexota bacterium]|nr:carbon monoxide dehydrogenase subunit G [Chloroflexota bacterium]MDE2685109.1 carbon monoxide dehydrogenase subunit G [Chloroflexota bacterium]
MQLSGEYYFSKPPQAVWDGLMNPDVLAGCIPGCRSIETDGPNRYRAVANVRVGPVSGNYTATVALSDLDPPKSYTMTIEGSGNLGFVNGTSTVTLTPADDGGTTVHVDVDSQVGGAVARVGQRMMGSVAKGMLDRFFGCLAESV